MSRCNHDKCLRDRCDTCCYCLTDLTGGDESELKTVKEAYLEYREGMEDLVTDYQDFEAGFNSRNEEIERLAKVNFKLNQTVQDYRDEVEQLKAKGDADRVVLNIFASHISKIAEIIGFNGEESEDVINGVRLLQSQLSEAKSDLQNAYQFGAETQDKLAYSWKMNERLSMQLLKAREIFSHILAMGHLTEGGSTEGWVKEFLDSDNMGSWDDTQ